jgi:exopolysaccharide production protein ExoY
LASISIPRRAATEGQPGREFEWQSAPENSELKWQMVSACERAISVGLLGVLSPFIAGTALVVRFLSGRAPFIAHRRVGWRGATLWMLKLRTMWGDDAGTAGECRGWVEYIDDSAGPERKNIEDPRVASRFARFCRMHSIDELPQLWHVLRGEMSLVGPRPVTADELRRYYGMAAAEVLQHRPGIAGLWQVSGRNRLTYTQRLELDLKLVRKRSLRLYWTILLRTIPEVFSGRNTC